MHRIVAIDDGEARPVRNKIFRTVTIVDAANIRIPKSPPTFRMTTRRSTGTSRSAATARKSVSAEPLQWMQETCPTDVLSKILAYCGPQVCSGLNGSNKFWNSFLKQDGTWKALCEELYKWKEGDLYPTCSWKDFYRHSPCVPVDYATIHAALAVATDPEDGIQKADIRVLIRPGEYYLKEAFLIQALPNVTVWIETMDVPVSPEDDASARTAPPPPTAAIPNDDEEMLEVTSPARRMLRRASSLLHNGCRSNGAVEEDDLEMEDSLHPIPSTRAALVSKTRRHNEPIIRVRQGTVRLGNLNIVHNTHGIDIWNGNAAIQIQPPIGPDDVPVTSNPRPTAYLHGVDVISRSGRGIVNIDGGMCSIASCLVHECAATGIYVGGPGSCAMICQTDVIRNGNGNRSRRGIARGHSGIYLEQGQAVVRDCNISSNALTGISAVSQENAILSLEESDLIANGSIQLDMPPNGTRSRRRSLTRDNNVSVSGLWRSRSGLAEQGVVE